MSYSPFVGPALFVVLYLSAVLPGLKKGAEEAAPQAAPETARVRRSTRWAFAAGGVAAAVVQAALNLWIPWLGDGVLAAAVAILLFVTRR